MSTKAPDLLPCPFCGGSAYPYRNEGGAGASCDYCGISMPATDWNARNYPYPRAAFGGEATQAQGWQPIDNAPYDTEVIVKVGRMTFPAILREDGATDEDGNYCDQWQAAEEGQHPPCWSGGACWESNSEGSPSMQPEGWRAIA